MAVEQGTATNYRDLVDKLRLFLTTNASLVGAGQNWQQLRWATTSTTQELILRAPGLAGLDNIYIGITSYESIPSDYFNMHIDGFLGYDPLLPFTSQPGNQSGSLTSSPTLHLWNGSIPYTFIANGRRCIVNVRINTSYFQAYFGLLTPFATATQNPYPLAIMAASSTGRWSAPSTVRYAWIMSNGSGSWTSNTALQSLSYTLDVAYGTGEYVLVPILASQISANAPLNKYIGSYFGLFDGMYFVSGVNNVSDNIIAVGGVNHLVAQAGNATGLNDYVALRLDV